MVDVHPQYINDIKGNKSMVVLSIHEFESLMEELEDLEDTCLYDEAQKEDTGERMLFSDYLNRRKAESI